MRKAQMSLFLLIGFVMFIFVAVVMSFAAQQRQEANQEQADNVASALLDSTTVRTYIQSCVSDSANRAFLKLMQHGGFYPNITIPGESENLNSAVSFLEYTYEGNSYKTARLLYKSPYDINPMYPCSFFDSICGDGVDSVLGSEEPGKQFCGFSLSNETQVANCNYGDRQPISLYFVPNSLANQLRYRVSHEVSECIEGSFFSELFSIDSADVSPESIETSVSFGSTAVSFTVNIPLVIQVGRAESISISSNSHNIEIDFSRMFNSLLSGPGSPLYEEWADLYNDILESAKEIIELNRLDYEVEQIFNLRAKDDLFIIRHKDLFVAGEPFEFRFIIGNRKPVLSEINYAKDNPYCEIEVPPGTNVTITPEYADPDVNDEITVRFREELGNFEHYLDVIEASDWDILGDTIFKNMTDLEHNYVEMIMVEISDGQYRNSQQVRVCVDNTANLNYEPRVEFLYDYSGFNKTYKKQHSDEILTRITTEDPIKLMTGQGFSGKGTWIIGNTGHDDCKLEDVSSSCVIFPGGRPCDEEFDIPISEIKNMMDICFTSYSNYVIRYIPENHPAIDVEVRVDRCVPHISSDGLSNDNPFLDTNVCCTNDFRYAGSSKNVYEREELYCGNPSFGELSSNNFYTKTTTIRCLSDRGNYYDESMGSSIVFNLDTEVPLVTYDGYRNCKGCGVFGTSVENNISIEYDYDDFSRHMSTFEHHFYKEEDPNPNPYLCDPNYSCTPAFSGSGRGEYDSSNYYNFENNFEPGIMKCQGACNRGECNFAVNCICTSDCGAEVSDICDGKRVGEESGTCTKSSFGQDYFPDVCSSACLPIQADDELRFRCDDPLTNPDSDCLHCNPLCDGKRPGENLDSCDLGNNNAVRDICNNVGQVVDRTESGGGMRCVYDPSMNCNAVPECHNTLIGGLARDAMGNIIIGGGSRIYLAAMCNEDCRLADSNICYRDPARNNVEMDCDMRERGEGFHFRGPSTIKDSFCTSNCAVEGCPGNFAYKGGEECLSNPSIENCCYSSQDLQTKTHYEVCNDLNPNTDVVNACVPA